MAWSWIRARCFRRRGQRSRPSNLLPLLLKKKKRRKSHLRKRRRKRARKMGLLRETAPVMGKSSLSPSHLERKMWMRRRK